MPSIDYERFSRSPRYRIHVLWNSRDNPMAREAIRAAIEVCRESKRRNNEVIRLLGKQYNPHK